MCPSDPLLHQAPSYNRPPAALLALDDHQGTAGGAAGDGDSGVYRLALVRGMDMGMDLGDGPSTGEGILRGMEPC